MVTPVPTLSTYGFVRDQASKIDYLLSHFFLSDYNQTYLYPGNVTSLPEIIQKHGGEVAGVISELNRRLRDYLLRYYIDVDLEIRMADNSDADLSTKAELIISVNVMDEGINSQFIRLLRSSDSRLSEIVKYNNDGAVKN